MWHEKGSHFGCGNTFAELNGQSLTICLILWSVAVETAASAAPACWTNGVLIYEMVVKAMHKAVAAAPFSHKWKESRSRDAFLNDYYDPCRSFDLSRALNCNWGANAHSNVFACRCECLTLERKINEEKRWPYKNGLRVLCFIIHLGFLCILFIFGMNRFPLRWMRCACRLCRSHFSY